MRVIRPRTLVFAYDKGTDDTRIIVTSYTYSIAAVSFFVPVLFSQDETSLTLIVIILCYAKYIL